MDTVSVRTRPAIRTSLSRVRWQVAGLSLAVVLIYAPVLNFEFLNWDDGWYITSNDLLKSWRPANLAQILTVPVARNFAPLTIFTFLCEYSIWGLWPGGYHATNVLIHLVNTVLVLQLLRQLTRNDAVAWMAAALFAVHPVQVESVAWISSRKTVLSATFMLASLICWLRVERSQRDCRWGTFWLALGLLTKASAVSVPPLVIAYDLLVARKKAATSLAAQVLPLGLCGLLILLTMNAQISLNGGVRGHLELNKLELLAVDATLLWRYVGMLVWPQHLCVLYAPPIYGIVPLMAISILGWMGIAMICWRCRESSPYITLGGIAWLMLFLPVLNLFPLTTLMNDRYLYLPCVPFFAVVVGVFQHVCRQLHLLIPAARQVTGLVGVLAGSLIIGLFTTATLNYLPVWNNSFSLWNYARGETPTLAKVQIQWAYTLELSGKWQAAEQVLKYARANCHPDLPEQQLIGQLLERIRQQQPVPPTVHRDETGRDTTDRKSDSFDRKFPQELKLADNFSVGPVS